MIPSKRPVTDARDTAVISIRERFDDALCAAKRSVGPHAAGASDGQRGVALLLVMTCIAILSIFSLEFTYQSRVAVRTSSYVENEIEAYLHARAAVELAGLVIGSVDIVESILNKYASMLGGRKPNISTAAYACEFVNAFCKGKMNLMGIPLVNLEGQEGAGLERGTCGCRSTDEDGRVNINRVNNLGEKQAVFDTLYKLLERNEGVTQVGELDKEMAQLTLNVIDWADKDTTKTDIDPSSRKLQQGTAAEGLAYVKNGYKSKNSAFDTTEEVRLVEGMSDATWCKLRNQLTVYNTQKLNVNTAPIEVIKALICKNLADPRHESIACARGFQQQTFVPVNVAGQYIEVCRTLKRLVFSPPFSTPSRFVRFFDKLGTVLPADYANVLRINRGRMLRDIGTTGSIVRITAYGTAGPVTKTVSALLDTTTKQWVYWRED
jgi:type II secretory pathway component PulK